MLVAAGVPGRVRILPEAAPTALAAAEQLGCPVGAIANSLIFATDDGEPLLIMTSGAHRVDVAKVGADLGVTLRRASAEFVRTHTGQPIGGVAPVGHPQPDPHPDRPGPVRVTTSCGRPAASRTRSSRSAIPISSG